MECCPRLDDKKRKHFPSPAAGNLNEDSLPHLGESPGHTHGKMNIPTFNTEASDECVDDGFCFSFRVKNQRGEKGGRGN